MKKTTIKNATHAMTVEDAETLNKKGVSVIVNDGRDVTLELEKREPTAGKAK
ncbi:MAG TPA: hypothetical protein VFD17_07230 [Clostridia bacterium]|nr:hypothetical protein [Clostridia bacterium]